MATTALSFDKGAKQRAWSKSVEPWRAAVEINYAETMAYDDDTALANQFIRPEDCRLCHGELWEVRATEGNCSRFRLPLELIRGAIGAPR